MKPLDERVRVSNIIRNVAWLAWDMSCEDEYPSISFALYTVELSMCVDEQWEDL